MTLKLHCSLEDQIDHGYSVMGRTKAFLFAIFTKKQWQLLVFYETIKATLGTNSFYREENSLRSQTSGLSLALKTYGDSPY